MNAAEALRERDRLWAEIVTHDDHDQPTYQRLVRDWSIVACLWTRLHKAERAGNNKPAPCSYCEALRSEEDSK